MMLILREALRKGLLILCCFTVMTVVVDLWGLLEGSPSVAQASHFRYAHYNWSPIGGTTVEFTLQQAWRRSAFSCVDPNTLLFTACSAEDGNPDIGDFIRPGAFRPGDGSSLNLSWQVTSVDKANDWIFIQAIDPGSLPAIDFTIPHTYPNPGNFVAFVDSCCRIGQTSINHHVNNSDGGFRVETIVNVSSGNSSPRTTLPPIVFCPINGLCSFTVLGIDPDGDDLNFRFSTAAEADSDSFTQPGPPDAPNAARLDPLTGLYTWDTTGATLGPPGRNTLYSTQVTIEDLDLSGNVKSKVAADFLIQLVTNVGSPPVFDVPPTPTCGSTLTVSPDNTLNFTVQASDADSDQSVTLNVAGLPASATLTPQLPTVGNPVSSVFNWTPTESQLGTQVVTFTATDDVGQQDICSVSIRVVLPRTGDLNDDNELNLTDVALFLTRLTGLPAPQAVNYPKTADLDASRVVNGDGDVPTILDAALLAFVVQGVLKLPNISLISVLDGGTETVTVNGNPGAVPPNSTVNLTVVPAGSMTIPPVPDDSFTAGPDGSFSRDLKADPGDTIVIDADDQPRVALVVGGP